MNDLVKYSERTFEDIKHTNEYGEEFWAVAKERGVSILDLGNNNRNATFFSQRTTAYIGIFRVAQFQ